MEWFQVEYIDGFFCYTEDILECKLCGTEERVLYHKYGDVAVELEGSVCVSCRLLCAKWSEDKPCTVCFIFGFDDRFGKNGVCNRCEHYDTYDDSYNITYKKYTAALEPFNRHTGLRKSASAPANLCRLEDEHNVAEGMSEWLWNKISGLFSS